MFPKPLNVSPSVGGPHFSLRLCLSTSLCLFFFSSALPLCFTFSLLSHPVQSTWPDSPSSSSRSPQIWVIALAILATSLSFKVGCRPWSAPLTRSRSSDEDCLEKCTPGALAWAFQSWGQAWGRPNPIVFLPQSQTSKAAIPQSNLPENSSRSPEVRLLAFCKARSSQVLPHTDFRGVMVTNDLTTFPKYLWCN